MALVPAPPKKRSAAIAIVGWLLFLSAILNITFGALDIFVSDVFSQTGTSLPILAEQVADDELTEQEFFLIDGVVSIFVGVVQLGLTIGFWREKRWAWVAAMSWQAFKLLFGIVAALAGPADFVSLAFAILLVFTLNQTDVRRVFNIRRQPDESSSVTPLRILDSN